ncbi:hypothetical protein J4714_12880 [Staphylococcus epidermidis]|nr:hypothetical protein [Staphylococcus epidermidis]
MADFEAISASPLHSARFSAGVLALARLTKAPKFALSIVGIPVLVSTNQPKSKDLQTGTARDLLPCAVGLFHIHDAGYIGTGFLCPLCRLLGPNQSIEFASLIGTKCPFSASISMSRCWSF